MITRRLFTSGAGLTIIGLGPTTLPEAGLAGADRIGTFRESIHEIETRSAGRLGVAFHDTATGNRIGYREHELFPLCSTFKVLAAGAVLTQVDEGQAQLTKRIRFQASDVVVNSPITKDRAGGDGMTLAQLCAAAIDYSDNTAGNMLLSQIGGPAGVTRFARTLGDQVTRLDRTETALNESLPGDPRDTTSPMAMVANLDALVLGSALSGGSRDQLAAWLKDNTTGGTRIRAGLPADWVAGDKTGAGERGSTNDIAVIWPPGRKPVLVAAYLTGTDAPVEERNAALAAVGRSVVAILRD